MTKTNWSTWTCRVAVAALVATLLGPAGVSAQSAEVCEVDGVRGGETLTVQPKIIVIPYTKDGENMGTVLEEDVNRRVAVTTVKQAFDDLGFTTIDLQQVIRTVRTNAAILLTAETDFQTQILQESRADIYVQLEIMDPEDPTSPSSASVIRTAFLTNTATSLANMIGRSGRYRGVEYSRLVERAASDSISPFLQVMQGRFDDVVANGAIISFIISVTQGAENDLGSEVGPDPDILAFLIEDWFAENAWKNNYSVSSSSSLRMVLDAVRIPLYDPTTCRNYNPSQFSQEFVRFLRTLNVRTNLPIINGGTIIIELR